MSEQSVVVKIGEQGRGRAIVPHTSGQIELVVAQAHYGIPHVVPHGADDSMIIVQGAEPDTEITVTFNVA